MNSRIKEQILSNEGVSKSAIRKIKPLMKDKFKDQRLFEGIRDQKVSAKWLKTPQPVEVKIRTIRSLKDKAPKGSYLLRASVLDRLIDNKMYYKFIEYGNLEKEKEQILKEELEEEKRIDEELAREREEHLRNNPFLGGQLSSGDLHHNSQIIQNNNHTLNQDEEEKGLFESDEED